MSYATRSSVPLPTPSCGYCNVIGVEGPRHAAQLLLGMANWTYKWVDPDHDGIDALADAAVHLVLGPTVAAGSAKQPY